MKPILFNTDMVRAILEDRKTVTRRAVKPQPINMVTKIAAERYHKPYRPGDILYVRETWAAWSRTEGTMPKLYYRVDVDAPNGIKWHPSIHMPREAARIFLLVTDVRAERLQDITDDDLVRDFGFCPEAIKAVGRDALAEPFWNSTIRKADRSLYGWEANPWVWVIEFERCETPKE